MPQRYSSAASSANPRSALSGGLRGASLWSGCATLRDRRSRGILEARAVSCRQVPKIACPGRAGAVATLAADGEVRDPGRRAPLRGDDRRRQQERGPADPRRLPAHRGGGRAHQRAADPRHRGPDRAARASSGSRSSGSATTACGSARRRRSPTRRRRGALAAGSAPRSCSPARCWPASARRTMPPPGRRLHRPPPPRPPPRRLPRPRRRGRRRPLDRADAPPAASAPARSSWTSRR